MTRSRLLVGAVACGALGLVDVGLLNLWFAPRAFPVAEQPLVALRTREERGASPTPATPRETRPASRPARSTPATRPAARPRAAPAPRPLAGPLVLRFATGSGALATEDVARVRALARAFRLERVRFSVEGHADRRGEAALNQRLSWQRARATAALLAEEVEAARIVARGRGSGQPVDPGDTPEAWARNRRVEIRMMRTEAEP